MPNLKPPITTTAAAVEYREAILKSLPAHSDFSPLMTLYLTDTTSPMEIKLASKFDILLIWKYLLFKIILDVILLYCDCVHSVYDILLSYILGNKKYIAVNDTGCI